MINNYNKEIYFICGPTAIGKSSLALRLAKKINGIIVNADSMQVYSNLRILTARPSKKDHYNIKHELYGYVDGSVRYNVAKWCNDIVKILENNQQRKIPSIIVGGTGMYIVSLLNGLIAIPPIAENTKKESTKLLKEIGTKEFIKKIKKFDSKALNKISYKDSLRIKRIWEIFHSTGIKYSDWMISKNKKFLNNFSYKIFLFTPSRSKIYNNVNLRFMKMIKEGAIEEVQKLLNLNLDLSLPIMRAHGVPEISKYLQNKFTLEECIVTGQKVTRNYVKRQLTWWKSSRLIIHHVFDQFPNEIDENMIKL